MFSCQWMFVLHLDSEGQSLPNLTNHESGFNLAFHLSVDGQKSVRARVTLFHQLQAKHQIPIKKSVKNKLMTT